MNDQERLERLIRAGHAAIAILTYEEQYALSLVRETAFKLGYDLSGTSLWLWSVSDGLRDGLVARPSRIENTEHPAAALLYLSRLDKPVVCVTLDLIGHLKDERTLRQFRDLLRRFEEVGSHLVMIDYQEEVPGVVAAHATRMEVSLPNEAELEAVVRRAVRAAHQERSIEIDMTRSGLRTVIRNLRGLTRRQAERIINDIVSEDRRFDATDINQVLAAKRQVLQEAGLLEYIEAPVDLSEIGGLRRLKSWLAQRQCAMTEEAAAYGLVCPRGVLMLGVQGAGKSLCAKAIATAWQQPLLRLDPAALYDRYVGESERRLRMSLRQAEMMAPIVLWIDEIEKGFASAASRSTDGGLSQRMFGSLLTWMQEHRSPVFVVATANDIEALPPELLRKGRFDEIFFVDLPGEATRRQIFEIHLRKRARNAEDFALEELAAAAEGYSGAEIEAAIVSALHKTFARKGQLTTQTLLEALKESPPLSITMAERVQALRDWARNRCVPAD
jgi:ATP-dependent 26S proteasome regulatory subunit